MKKRNSVTADQTSLVFLLASTASLAQRYQAQNEINNKEDSGKKSKTLHRPEKNDNGNKM